MDMSKKQFVLDALGIMAPKWDLATDLKKLVSLDMLDNQAVNAIVDLIRQMAKYIKNKAVQTRMNQIADKLEAMRQSELQDHIQDEEDTRNLLASLKQR